MTNPTTEAATEAATYPAQDVRKKRRNVLRIQVPEKLIALATITGEAPEALAERMLGTQVELAAANVAAKTGN